ncbi:bacterial Ig-like domain family protein, partial [Acinetobacter baumannii 25561_1]
PHTITVTATDAAGNVGNDTAVVTIDTVAPNAPVLDPINATDPVSGQAEPGSTVTVTYPDGTTATVVRLHQMHRCLIRSMQQTQ